MNTSPDKQNERVTAVISHYIRPNREAGYVEISATTQARCMIIGGEPLGERYKWWNFVSSSEERIEQAKHDWQSDKFPQVPTENEFIPLLKEQNLESEKPVL